MLDYQSPSDIERHDVIRSFRRLRMAAIICAAVISIGVAVAHLSSPIFIPTAKQPKFVWLTTFFFRDQDAFWLVGVAALLVGFSVLRLPVAGNARLGRLRCPGALVAILAVFVLICGVAGAHVVFHDHHLSRDESLAEFDATILRSGQPIAPIAPEWRPFASALAPAFMVPVAHAAGFVSAYLPVNAGFRAIVGFVLDPAWTSPLLAALAVIAVFMAARRLWPSRADAALVAAMLTATSSQVLVASMTSYAMTAHLALNLLWLWFFLRDDEFGHGAAIGVSALAVGLHQVIFHPLFVAPFIVRLWASKRFSLALVYIVAYMAIVLFWIGYWQFALEWQGVSPEASDEAGPLYFVARVAALLSDFQWSGADLMLKNVLRFIAWQNPALLPLAFLACHQIRSGSGIARELAAGVALTLVAMFIVLPYQGHGWGYRYLHGLIGNLSLLAAYGWVSLSPTAVRGEMNGPRSMLAIGSAVACLVLLPAHARQAESFVAPYARAAEVIARAPTDLVIVDKSGLLFAEDLVRNDPFLRNRPKILDITFLDETRLVDLCARYSISLFERSQALRLGIPANDELTKVDDAARAKMRTVMEKLSCDRDLALPAP